MIKNRVFYVLLLVAAVLVYIFTNSYYTLTILCACVAAPIISLVLMLIAGRNVSVKIETPATAEKKSAAIRYIITNSGRLPAARVTFNAELQNLMTGAVGGRKVSATVGSKDSIEAVLSLRNSRVGTVAIRTAKIRVYDAFGLFAFRKANLAEETIIIYPDMRDVHVNMENPAASTVDGSRYSPNKPGMDVSEIFAMREYVPGDEIRKIHWKLSGKTDKLMVRDFSLPLNYSVFLLLELQKGSEDLVDAQVEVFLSISRALLESGVNHNMGWYDASDDMFHAEEIDDFESLEIASAHLLSAYAGESSDAAIDFYTTGGNRSNSNILIYVTIDPQLEKIAEIEVSQRTQTVIVYEDAQKAALAEELEGAVTVSVKEAKIGIPEITV